MPEIKTRAAREITVELPFPVRGIDQSLPRCKQGALTCASALNVDPFPPLADRLVGGKRAGTRRAFTNAVAAAAANPLTIIGLNHVPAAQVVGSAQLDLTYVYPTADLSGYPLPASSWVRTGGTTNLYNEIDEAHGSGDDTDYDSTQPGVTGTLNPASGFKETKMRWTLGAGANVPPTNTGMLMFLRFRVRVPASGGNNGAPGAITTPAVPATGGVAGSVNTTNAQTIQGGALSPDALMPYVPPGSPFDGTGPSCAGNVRFTFYYDNTGSGDWRVLYYADTPFSGATGDWISLSPLSNTLSAVPAACWTNAGRLMIECTAGENGHCGNTFVDVAFAHAGWLSTGTPPPGNGPATGLVLILLSDKCYVADLNADALNTPTASTGLTKQTPSIAWYAGKWYVVDGNDEKIIDTASPPVVTDYKTASDGAYASGNTFPAKCRIICHWRNRAVQARQEGVANGETLGFMSAAGDFLDYRIALDSEKPAEISAIAFSNKFVNTPADAITALIPWSDDLLIVGGANTISKFEGDPGQGGTFANLTQQTGIMGDRAWCFDQGGHLYFIGTGGLYRLSRDGEIKDVSGRRLYRYLDRLDGRNNLIQLVYDGFAKKVHIFFTPLGGAGVNPLDAGGGTAGTSGWLSIVYDITTDSFWFYQYPQRFGPYAVCRISGATDDDRRFLMGGSDGHIRRPFDGGKLTTAGIINAAGTARYGTADDLKRDGSAIAGATESIEWSVRYAPIEGALGDCEIMATEIAASGVDNNYPLNLPVGPSNWYWLAADSAAVVGEIAVQANALAAGAWFGPGNYGLQQPTGMRVTGGAHQLVVRQNSATQSGVCPDRVVVKFRQAGRRR